MIKTPRFYSNSKSGNFSLKVPTPLHDDRELCLFFFHLAPTQAHNAAVARLIPACLAPRHHHHTPLITHPCSAATITRSSQHTLLGVRTFREFILIIFFASAERQQKRQFGGEYTSTRRLLRCSLRHYSSSSSTSNMAAPTVYRRGSPRKVTGECNTWCKIWALQINGVIHQASKQRARSLSSSRL